ncbi:MAG: hypothetical protein P8Y38_14695 [Deltaproteobacteria bacterium]
MRKPLAEHKARARQNPCIWMQAGVVRSKHCQLNYQCTACRYDKALRRVAEENRMLRKRGVPPHGRRARIVAWKDRLRELPSWKQPCLHSMKGRIEFRACTNDYSCVDCEFDQFFYDQFTVHAVVKPVAALLPPPTRGCWKTRRLKTVAPTRKTGSFGFMLTTSVEI